MLCKDTCSVLITQMRHPHKAYRELGLTIPAFRRSVAFYLQKHSLNRDVCFFASGQPWWTMIMTVAEKNESERKSSTDLFCCLQNIRRGYITSQQRAGVGKKGDKWYFISHLSSDSGWLNGRWRTCFFFFFSVGSGVLMCRCLRAMSQEGSCAVG